MGQETPRSTDEPPPPAAPLPAAFPVAEPLTPLEDLVFEYLERIEDLRAGVLEEMCRLHPQEAAALCARIDALRRLRVL